MPGDRRQIFISYRRGDEPGYTQSLYLMLEQTFGAGAIFKDIEGGFQPGDDFPDELRRRVAEADILLAVIGPGWLTAANGQGRRRLDDPTDWVRIEIAAALGADKRVVPVLVNGAQHLTGGDLPDALTALARKQAHSLNNATFVTDGQTLIRKLSCIPGLAARDQEPGWGRRNMLTFVAGGLAGAGALWLALPHLTAKEEPHDIWDDLNRHMDPTEDQSLRVFEGHLDSIQEVRLRPDGRTAVSTSADQTVRIWDVETGETLRQLLLPLDKKDGFWKATLSSDARLLVRWQDDKPAELWDLDSGSVLRPLVDTKGRADAVFSPDSRFIAISGAGGAPGVWDVASGKRVSTIGRDWSDAPMAMAFRPSGGLIGTYHSPDQSSFRFIDPFNGRREAPVIIEFDFSHQRPERIAISPDDQTVIVYSRFDDPIHAYTLPAGNLRWKLAIDPNRKVPPSAWIATFSADGTRVVTGGTDNRVHVFDASTGTQTHTLTGHSNWVQAIAVSADGRHILSGGGDYTLRLWEMPG